MSFYHVRRLKQICRLLGPDIATTLVSAFVLACNAMGLGYLPVSERLLLHLYSVHRTQQRDWLLGLDFVTTSAMRCVICIGCQYAVSHTSSDYYVVVVAFIQSDGHKTK